jgi:hypothetical protein
LNAIEHNACSKIAQEAQPENSSLYFGRCICHDGASRAAAFELQAAAARTRIIAPHRLLQLGKRGAPDRRRQRVAGDDDARGLGDGGKLRAPTVLMIS